MPRIWRYQFPTTLFVAVALSCPATAQSVSSISTSEAAKLLTNPRAVVLLDVREREEFAISRIPNALNIPASTETDRTESRLVRIVSGKILIIYCTLGTRSADFATFAETGLKRLGAKSIYILSGGIIAWHNEERRLVDRKGATRLIHPFRNELVRMLRHSEFARIKAR